MRYLITFSWSTLLKRELFERPDIKPLGSCSRQSWTFQQKMFHTESDITI